MSSIIELDWGVGPAPEIAFIDGAPVDETGGAGTSCTSVTLQDALAYKLAFGEHRGRTLGELAASYSGRKYLSFMVTKALYSSTLAMMQKVLDNTPEVDMTRQDAQNVKFRFGKYKGKTLRYVKSRNGGVRHLGWALRADYADEELKMAIRMLVPSLRRT